MKAKGKLISGVILERTDGLVSVGLHQIKVPVKHQRAAISPVPARGGGDMDSSFLFLQGRFMFQVTFTHTYTHSHMPSGLECVCGEKHPIIFLAAMTTDKHT